MNFFVLIQTECISLILIYLKNDLLTYLALGTIVYCSIIQVINFRASFYFGDPLLDLNPLLCCLNQSMHRISFPCCIKKTIFIISVSVRQEPGCGLAGPFTKVLTRLELRCQLELQSPL